MLSGCSYLKPDLSLFFINKDEGKLYPENNYGKKSAVARNN